jgi:hypothetical protein
MKKIYTFLIVITLGIAGINSAKAQLFINEFMASNDEFMPGPQGDYPDWIEIYNAGDTDISLANYYMSDNIADTSKWVKIPDTYPDSVTVPANGFLVLYANKMDDISVLCLHFKLSGNGEQIGLWDADMNVIDTLTYGPVPSDTSYGRYPDGTADWVIMPEPTPGAANMYSSIVENKNDITLFQNRPNPFRGETTIDFTLLKRDFVTIKVYNLTGQVIATLANGYFTTGKHSVTWNANNLPTGYYLYSIESTNGKIVKKATVLK